MGKCDSYKGKQTGERKYFSEGPDVKLNKKLKVVIRITFKELKENMLKEGKEGG